MKKLRIHMIKQWVLGKQQSKSKWHNGVSKLALGIIKDLLADNKQITKQRDDLLKQNSCLLSAAKGIRDRFADIDTGEGFPENAGPTAWAMAGDAKRAIDYCE